MLEKEKIKKDFIDTYVEAKENIIVMHRLVYSTILFENVGMYRASKYWVEWLEKTDEIMKENNLSAETAEIAKLLEGYFHTIIEQVSDVETGTLSVLVPIDEDEYVFTFSKLPAEFVYQLEAMHPADIQIIVDTFGLDRQYIVWLFEYRTADDAFANIENIFGVQDVEGYEKILKRVRQETERYELLLIEFARQANRAKRLFDRLAKNTNNLEKLIVSEFDK